jgi:gentisate 1,2-dioxygenase
MASLAAAPPPKQVANPERLEFYDRIGGLHLTPLWEVLDALVPKAPCGPCVPAGWHYQDVRPHLLEAGRLITAKEAERRVLILENPGLPGRSCITQTLYAGLQLLLPGEIAPSHRHSQSALRLVLEGEGAYTAVGGERTIMLPGDFVITPSMSWHDHGNPGDAPVIWLDGLDIPLLRFLDAGFAQKYPHESHPITRPLDDASARFGANLAPIDYCAPDNGASPLINYRYSKTRSALFAIRNAGPADAWLGYALRFLHPTTGGSPMRSIGAYVQLFPARFQGRPYRSTDGRVFCCLEGEGRIDTESWSFEFGAPDVFVVPSWTAYRLHTGVDTVLFGFSDGPVQHALGLWREERL